MSDLVGTPEDRISRVAAQMMVLVWLWLNITVNNFSVMFGQCHCFLDINQYSPELKAQRHYMVEVAIITQNLPLQSPVCYHMSRIVRKPDFCLCENKGADQLRSNREADQRLCFRYTDSIFPLLLISEISST